MTLKALPSMLLMVKMSILMYSTLSREKRMLVPVKAQRHLVNHLYPVNPLHSASKIPTLHQTPALHLAHSALLL
jgi:hypothetical protein